MKSDVPTSKPGKYESFFDRDLQDYLVTTFGGEDDALRRLRVAAVEEGLPQIAISAFDGYVLRFLLSSIGARRAVEIGTLGGYSALWIARSLRDGGHLDSFELDPVRAEFARRHINAAALRSTVTVHTGPALENLHRVQTPVDFVFIDADKSGYPRYLSWAAEHVRPGGMVALDNSFAWGALLEPDKLGDRSEDAVSLRRAIEALANDGRWIPAMIPTNEGLAVGIRRE